MAGRARSSSQDPPSAKRTKFSDDGNPSAYILEASSTGTEINHQQQQKLHDIDTTSDLSLEVIKVLSSSDNSVASKKDDDNNGQENNQEELTDTSSSTKLTTTTTKTVGAVKASKSAQADEMGNQRFCSLDGLINENPSYHALVKIGDGAYGKVFKARNRINGQVVALKRLNVPMSKDGLPLWIVREISTLKKLNEFKSPYVVKLLDVCQGNFLEQISIDIVSEHVNNQILIWLVFEHVEQDLAAFIDSCKQHSRCSQAVVRHMFKEILLGLEFLHINLIIHRDIKPQNLLVTRDGHIKIADFGLSKTYNFDMLLTTVVVTLWYRAPEVLLSCSYASPIDIWSVGCVISELSQLKPLFPGRSEGEQLEIIFEALGTPARDEWPNNVSLSWDTFSNQRRRPFKTLISNLNEIGLDLVSKMLVFNPHHRITASQALAHPYFLQNDL